VALFTLGKSVRRGHYEKQICPQLLAHVGPYSSNGLALVLYPKLLLLIISQIVRTLSSSIT
jgi:hypothetical protein